jgi:predicted  nucleic acid-binding Zn-ribbon protein
MTAQNATDVTLEAVRDRFLKAEANLLQLTEGLARVQNASQRFDGARELLTQAQQRLVRVSDEIGAGAQALAKCLELVRGGIGVLEKTDPGKLLAEISHLSTAVRTQLQQVADGLENVRKLHDGGLKGLTARSNDLLTELREAREDLQRSLQKVDAEIQKVDSQAARGQSELSDAVAHSTEEVLRSLSEAQSALARASEQAVTNTRELKELAAASQAQTDHRIDQLASQQREFAEQSTRALGSGLSAVRSDVAASGRRLTWLVVGVGLVLLSALLIATVRAGG